MSIEAILNDFWYKATIFGLLLMFVCAPFAGFAPLLLIILVGVAYWFFAPIFQAFFNKPEIASDCEASRRHRSNSTAISSPPESPKK